MGVLKYILIGGIIKGLNMLGINDIAWYIISGLLLALGLYWLVKDFSRKPEPEVKENDNG